MIHAKRVGSWEESKHKFIRKAALGDMAMLHARWATCGDKDAINQAHPFEIRRGGKVSLYGMHNGMIWNARRFCKANGRKFSVDSKELFELMADGETDQIREMEGYGVIVFYTPGTKHLNLVRLSESSEICVVAVRGGGLVYASTWEILKNALDYAELTAETEYNIRDIGRVYQMRDAGVYSTPVNNLKFDDKPKPKDRDSRWINSLIRKYQEEEEEKEALYWEIMSMKEGDDVPMFDEHLHTSWEREEVEDNVEYPSIAGVWE